jgi:hypothetical protein
LQIHRNSNLTWKDVQHAFARYALHHHPDQGGSLEAFVQGRQALEAIRQDLLQQQKRQQSTRNPRLNNDYHENKGNTSPDSSPHVSGMSTTSPLTEEMRQEMLELYRNMSRMGKLRGWEVEIMAWLEPMHSSPSTTATTTHNSKEGDDMSLLESGTSASPTSQSSSSTTTTTHGSDGTTHSRTQPQLRRRRRL